MEFGVVGSVFIFTVVSIIVFGVHLLTQGALDAATQAVAREIQIGGTYRGNTAKALQDYICGQMPGLGVTCTNIQVYVTSGATFASLTPAVVAGSTLTPATVDSGAGLSKVLLQTAYTSPFYIPIARLGYLTVTSAVAFQNEP